MKLNPHLCFAGQCAAAFRVYERCLGGKITFTLTWGDSPMANDVPADWRTKICHSTLTIGDNVLTGADVPPGQYQQPRGFEILIGIKDSADAQRIFEALSENGTVKMPLQETFWAARFGVVVDQFGIPWSINCEKSQ